MKRNLIVLFFLTAAFGFEFGATGQDVLEDVVYLKNGSIIRGTITELIVNDHLKIETRDKNLFVFKMEEVEKVVKEKVINEEKVQVYGKKETEEEEHEPEKRFRQKGSFHMLRLGQSLEDISGNSFAIGTIHGLQFNEYLSIGAGIEANTSSSEDFNNGTVGLVLVPVFMDIRFFIPKRRIHPMFFLDLGYTLPNKDYSRYSLDNTFVFVPDKGGFYRALGGGMKLFINEKISFMADGGLFFQSLKGTNVRKEFNTQTQTYYDIKEPGKSKNLTSLRLNVSFAFNINTK